MAQVNLILYVGNLKDEIADSDPSLPNQYAFTHYEVVEGKWILYKNRNYNDAIVGGSKKDILVLEKPTVKTPLPDDFIPRSVKRLHDQSDSAEVFEHVYYGGYSKSFTDDCSDVNEWFHAGCISGASSIIIWPNKSWELRTEKKYGGLKSTLEGGKYPTPRAMGFINDALQSLRRK